jgi:hypothetical protein
MLYAFPSDGNALQGSMPCPFPSDGTPAPGCTLCEPTRRKCVRLGPRRVGSGAEAPATGIPEAAGPENVAPGKGAVEGRDLATGGPADPANKKRGVAPRCSGNGAEAPGTGIPATAGLDNSAPGKEAFEGRDLWFFRLRGSRVQHFGHPTFIPMQTILSGVHPT